jgi:hypothetical protein
MIIIKDIKMAIILIRLQKRSRNVFKKILLWMNMKSMKMLLNKTLINNTMRIKL